MLGQWHLAATCNLPIATGDLVAGHEMIFALRMSEMCAKSLNASAIRIALPNRIKSVDCPKNGSPRSCSAVNS